MENSRGREREYVVLLEDYELAGERVAVSLNSSRCELGKTTQAGEFRQWFKYNLSLQPLGDDGEIQWFQTPTTSLNVTLRPQYPSLEKQTEHGVTDNWTPPFGSGTELITQTTWAEDDEEIQTRALELVQGALGYEADELDIQNDSRRFWKQEVHHRVSDEQADEVVHVLRQSSELLARHEAKIEETSVYSDGEWQIVKLRTDGWEQLGFPILRGQTIQIKLYLPDAPAEYLEYPMDQPKVKVSLEGRPKGGDAYHADRWEQINHVLEQVLCSHLRWPDVGTEHILQDDMSEGPHADLLQWDHPEGRRAWLRNHYDSLLPELYAEARKADTTAVYDILHSVKRRGAATYDQIAQDVRLTKRQVTGHVARLCGDDECPGILKRITSSATVVSFSARFWEDDAHEALDQCYPDDEAADRQERVESRLLKRTLGMTPADQERRNALEPAEYAQLQKAIDRATGQAGDNDRDGLEDSAGDPDELESEADDASPGGNASSSPETWDLFADVGLSPDELAVALEQQVLAEDRIKVRTDPYPALAD
ncbi:hypothetical protein OB920_04950 [Halobacteria archaeon HArc-gm2]|nr:hypothetical protein [Halobacteria archaeon HArc-gm2]